MTALSRVRVTEGKITVNVSMTEIQGKSILVRVSARFELARVRVIGSRLEFPEGVNSGTRLPPTQVLLGPWACGIRPRFYLI